MKPIIWLFSLFLVLVPFPLCAQRIPEAGELVAAVDTLDRRRVDELLGRGANPNAVDAAGQTPLCAALRAGSIQLVQLLLGSGANPDKPGSDGLTPLMMAINLSREDFFVSVLVAGASPNIISDLPHGSNTVPRSALSLALDRGEWEIARRLLSAGANPFLLAHPGETASNPLNLPKTRVPLDTRIFRDLADIHDAAFSPDWLHTAGAAGDKYQLHRASLKGDWRELREYLDSGIPADLADERGVTALMIAAFHGHSSLLSLLLQRGAKIDLRDDKGRNALSYAAASGHSVIVRRLIESGISTAPVAENRMESSPAYFALVAAHHEILTIFLDAGAPVDISGEEGITPLMLAAWLGDSFALREILPYSDADGPAIKDDAGRSALAWSAAAFDRDRYVERDLKQTGRASRNYSVARILSRRRRNPANFLPQPSTDIETDVINSWSSGRHPVEADDWRGLMPSPVPSLSGDGDLTLYRIFRDEEPGKSGN